MKPLMKNVVVPVLAAVFVWFSLSEHGGFVQRLLSYVYDMDYYLAEALDGQDYANDAAGQYWIPVGEMLPIEGDYNITTIAGTSRYPADVNNGDFLYIVVEITEKSKDGPDACAPEGYFHDYEVVSVPEGAMHSTAVLWINPLIETGYVRETGVYNCPVAIH
jgi:hypothetical protein